MELISRGYKLSYPLSPITRLEQEIKSKNSIKFRKKTFFSINNQLSMLKIFFEKISKKSEMILEIFKKDSNDIINENEITLTILKNYKFKYIFLRSHLLSELCELFSFPDNKQFNLILNLIELLLHSIQNEIKQLKIMLNQDFWLKEELLKNNTKEKISHNSFNESINKFIFTSVELKMQLETILTRIQMCQQTIIENFENNQNNIEIYNELLINYQMIQKELCNSLDIWEFGLKILQKNFNKTPKIIKNEISLTNIEENQNKQIEIIPIEMNNFTNLEVLEQNFEAYTGIENEESQEQEKSQEQEENQEQKENFKDNLLDSKGDIDIIPPPPPPFPVKKEQKKTLKKKINQNVIINEQKNGKFFEKKQVIEELKDVLSIRIQSKKK